MDDVKKLETETGATALTSRHEFWMLKGLENLPYEAQLKRLWLFPWGERRLRGTRTHVSQCVKACQAGERESDNEHDDYAPEVLCTEIPRAHH